MEAEDKTCFERLCFAPESDSHIHSCPLASNEFNGIFVGILKIEKM
jgi:hypothetical protein